MSLLQKWGNDIFFECRPLFALYALLPTPSKSKNSANYPKLGIYGQLPQIISPKTLPNLGVVALLV